MKEKIDRLISESQKAAIETKDQLEQFRLKFLVKKGLINNLFQEFKKLDSEEKKKWGKDLNIVKQKIESIFKDVVWRIVTNDPKTGVTNTSSIKEEKKAVLTLYPNPANHNLNINFGENVKNTSLSIFNMMGQKVIQVQRLSGNSVNINLQDLNPGIYQVIIQSGEQKNIKKY